MYNGSIDLWDKMSEVIKFTATGAALLMLYLPLTFFRTQLTVLDIYNVYISATNCFWNLETIFRIVMVPLGGLLLKIYP